MDKVEEDAKLLVAFCHKNYCWLRVKEILKNKGVFGLKDLAEHIKRTCQYQNNLYDFEKSSDIEGQEFFQSSISFCQWAAQPEGYDYWAYISFCWRMIYAIHYKTKEAHDKFIKKANYLLINGTYSLLLHNKIQEKFNEYEKSDFNC